MGEQHTTAEFYVKCRCGWTSPPASNYETAGEDWQEHTLLVTAAESGEDQVGSGHQEHSPDDELHRLAVGIEQVVAVLERLALAAENATLSRPYPNYRL